MGLFRSRRTIVNAIRLLPLGAAGERPFCQMKSPIQGVYRSRGHTTAAGTEDINLGAMWDLIDFLVSHGVQGIVLLGATGEFVHFSTSERMRLMGLASKRSRVPVIFNCSHSSFDGTVELTEAAEAAGAAAVLIMPPYFFRYTQCQIADFYRQAADSAEAKIPSAALQFATVHKSSLLRYRASTFGRWNRSGNQGLER